jgi:hypothetical protein
VVAQPAGHPGHPVLVGDGGLSLSGAVGSLIHIRLAESLPLPDPYGRDGRFSLRSTGDWAGLLIAPESRDGAQGQLALVTASPSITCQGTCPEATFGTIAVAFSSALPAGDYVVALAGPRGKRVDARLAGRDPTLAPTVLKGAYAMPYVSGAAPDPRGTSVPHRTAVAGLAEPALGRRTLGVVLVGVHEHGSGRNVDIKFCVGGFTPNDPADAARDAAQPSCSGGGYGGGSAPAAKIPLDSTLLSPPPFALLSALSGTGTYEINAGGGWAASCNDSACTFDGRVFDIALDS